VTEGTQGGGSGGSAWTVERANAALPRVRAALERIRELVVEVRRQREETAGRVGREYLLCWRLGESAVAWWHWPDSGFAGRRPLSDPPG
jgi:hypothetical protein